MARFTNPGGNNGLGATEPVTITDQSGNPFVSIERTGTNTARIESLQDDLSLRSARDITLFPGSDGPGKVYIGWGDAEYTPDSANEVATKGYVDGFVGDNRIKYQIWGYPTPNGVAISPQTAGESVALKSTNSAALRWHVRDNSGSVIMTQIDIQSIQTVSGSGDTPRWVEFNITPTDSPLPTGYHYTVNISSGDTIFSGIYQATDSTLNTITLAYGPEIDGIDTSNVTGSLAVPSIYNQVEAREDGVWIKNANWTEDPTYSNYWNFQTDGGLLFPDGSIQYSAFDNGTTVADNFESTNNGNGTNFKVGDDVWLGDINVENTLSVKGIEDPTQGYIQFGGNGKSLGSNSSGNLSWNGANVATESFVSTSYAPLHSPTFSGTVTTDTIAASAVNSTVGIASNLTTGGINIAQGATFAGSVNIATGTTSTGTKSVNIGTGGTAGSTTAINIGTGSGGTSTTTIYGANTYIGGPSGWGFTSQNINFGSSGSGIGFFAGNLTTGSMGIANGLTSGTLNLANGSNFSGIVNIATGAITAGTKTVNIGTGSGAGSTTNINIGGTGGTTTISLQATSITTNAASFSVGTILSSSLAAGNIFNNVSGSGSAVDIGASAETLHIMRATSGSKILNLAAGNLTTGTKTVNVGTGSTGGTTTVNVGSSAGADSTIHLSGKVVVAAGNVPASATATGIAGQVAWDANYFYVCTATNTWVRTALSTW